MPRTVLVDTSTVNVLSLVDVDCGGKDRYVPSRPMRLYDELGWEMLLEYVSISRDPSHIKNTGKLVIDMKEGDETYKIPLTLTRTDTDWTVSAMLAENRS